MTRKRAERLTGYEIRDIPAVRGLVGVGAFDGPTSSAKRRAARSGLRSVTLSRKCIWRTA